VLHGLLAELGCLDLEANEEVPSHREALVLESGIGLETFDRINQLWVVLYHHQLPVLALGLELFQLIERLRPGCGEGKWQPRLLTIDLELGVEGAGLAGFPQAANRMASAVEDFHVAGSWNAGSVGFHWMKP